MTWLQRGGGPSRELGVAIGAWAIYQSGRRYWCFQYRGQTAARCIYWEINEHLLGIPGCLQPEYDFVRRGRFDYLAVGDAEADWQAIQADPIAFMMEVML